MKKPNKLNLGCGYDYRAGWVNLDNCKTESFNPDVLHNLNKAPYPFKDNTFEYVLANNILEHLDSPLACLEELWRISKSGAIIDIKVPYFTSWTAWGDITHKRPFTYNTFSMLCGFGKKGMKVSSLYTKPLFAYKKRRLIWGTTQGFLLKQIAGFMNWLVNLNPEFLERRMPFLIPIELLHVELIVKK
jgi:SAM-dependent methyltransferase